MLSMTSHRSWLLAACAALAVVARLPGAAAFQLSGLGVGVAPAALSKKQHVG